MTMTLEEHLDEWLKQPGTFVTPAERAFIEDMRVAAAQGVGYGWMQQVTEWEWQSKEPKGAWGPEYFSRYDSDADRFREALVKITGTPSAEACHAIAHQTLRARKSKAPRS